MRAARDVVVALGAAAGAALVGAAVVGARAAAVQGYWAGGYLRIALDEIWERFDPAAAIAAAVALLVLGGLRLFKVRPGPRLFRPAFVILAAVALLRVAALLDAWHASRGPNVLLVSIDTLRADHLGTYGEPLHTSPTIDRRLSGEGVTFEHALSQSPKTTPSHMTMLTSLYPCVHGIELWEHDAPGHVLNPVVMTLAETLKNAGYATAAFTGGTNVHRSRGFDQGFDVYKHSDQLARASAWIRAHRRRRWFVFFHTFDVHDPYTPPDDLIAQFDGTYQGPVRAAVTKIRNGVGGWDRAHEVFWQSVDEHDPPTVRFVTHLYDAAIRRMDGQTIAPLLDVLDQLDLARDTLVVFTSDHGEAFGEHGRFMHDDLYAGTLHVPLILRFPGRLPPGRRVAAPARTLDVMPTILDLVGVKPPADVEGRSLVPLMDGAAPATDVLSEYDNSRSGRRYHSLRRGSLVYIADGGAESLFDTAQDPGETQDVAPSRPDEVAGLRATAAAWRAACRAGAARLGPTGVSVTPDKATRDRLRALGYVD